MREIKFRLIWNGNIVGYEFHYQGELPAGMTLISEGDRHRHGIYHARGGDNAYTDITDGIVFVPHDHKDQFTGLKDKNGVEIYEGDIVNVAHSIYPGQGREKVTHTDIGADIIWNERQAIFMIRTEECRETSYPEPYIFHAGPMKIKVIGNIYENSELLNAR